MFKNLTAFHIGGTFDICLDAMDAALAKARFKPCGPTDEKSVGFVEPRGQNHGALIESAGCPMSRILRVRIETKNVPTSEIRKKAQASADHIETTTGRKPGKREMKGLQEEAKLALLPTAFTRESHVWVWMDLANNILYTDAISGPKLDDVISLLVRALDGLGAFTLQTVMSPQACMTSWLLAESSDDWPEGFSIERECELRASGESMASVRFAHHHLQNDEVRKHIQEGKLPIRLALSWEGRVSFVLTDDLQVRKITFLEGVFDKDGASQEKDGYDPFDADVNLTTGELGKMLPALFAALGGVAPRSAIDLQEDAAAELSNAAAGNSGPGLTGAGQPSASSDQFQGNDDPRNAVIAALAAQTSFLN